MGLRAAYVLLMAIDVASVIAAFFSWRLALWWVGGPASAFGWPYIMERPLIGRTGPHVISAFILLMLFLIGVA